MLKRKGSTEMIRIPKKQARYFTLSSMIKVVVGEEETNSRTFFIHEDVLRERSEFFHRALNGSWKASEDKLVELREEDPSTFFLYTQCIYDNKIPVLSEVPKDHAGEYIKLSRLYVLAEMLQDTDTRNLVIDAIIETCRDPINGLNYYPTPKAIDILYEGTVESSPARQLMVDFYVYKGNEKWLSGDQEKYNPEFVFDVAKQCLQKRKCEIPKTSADWKAEEYYVVEPGSSNSGVATDDDSGA